MSTTKGWVGDVYDGGLGLGVVLQLNGLVSWTVEVVRPVMMGRVGLMTGPVFASVCCVKGRGQCHREERCHSSDGELAENGA